MSIPSSFSLPVITGNSWVWPRKWREATSSDVGIYAFVDGVWVEKTACRNWAGADYRSAPASRWAKNQLKTSLSE
ncbi:MAG: hypothetical protein BWX70_03208 [Verrucomicrobia bacterium ADurb.Bin070]|nr:MAG: hypothetical protein BWX70_03208 [Verrucomicrobia bacterium ADurb.Bin070]